MAKQFNPFQFRNEFPFTKKLAYLNHAAEGPIPLCSLKAVQKFYRYLSLEKISIGHDYQFSALEESRKLAARLIGAKVSEIGIIPNTSYGLNVVSQGLKLRRGDTVLLSDVEFPANVYPWLNLRQDGVKIKFIKTENGFFSVNNFSKAIDSSCRVLTVSFVQYFNGYKNDLETLGQLCKEKGLVFVVDGMQGVGSQTLDVKKCKIGFLSCGGGKWLLSAPGTGFIYVSEELQKRLKPVFFGWLGVDWRLHFEDLQHYDKFPFASARKFEIGTYPYAELQILASSLKLIAKVGVPTIQEHTQGLLGLLIDYLLDSGYEIKSSLDSKHRSGILSFTCKKAEHLHRKLFRQKIICSYREKSLRIAPHLYNTAEEMERLIDVLRKNRL